MSLVGTIPANCTVCSASCTVWATRSTPYGEFRIVRCVVCGFAFVSPRPTAEFLSSFYSRNGHGASELKSLEQVLESEWNYPNSTLDARRIVGQICHLVKSEINELRLPFLDIGCGYGFFSREAVRRGFKVVALEVAEHERVIAEQVTGLRPNPTSFEAFAYAEESFVALLMSQILEHALDVNEWIEKAHRLLKPSGILAIALPNFGSFLRLLMREREPYICPPAHLNFFTSGSLLMLLGRHGFIVRRAYSVSRIDPNVVLRRVPLSRAFGPKVVRLATQCCFAPVDSLGLGMMINIYAQKQPTTNTNAVGKVTYRDWPGRAPHPSPSPDGRGWSRRA